MSGRHIVSFVLLSTTLGVLVSGVVAGEPCSVCRTPRRPMKRVGHERAGQPQCLSILAKHSNTDRYCGGYVGGGAVVGGQPRFVDQGTWGWDYSGIAFPKHVWPSWWQGSHAQGGTGAYKTDGPKVLSHEE